MKAQERGQESDNHLAWEGKHLQQKRWGKRRRVVEKFKQEGKNSTWSQATSVRIRLKGREKRIMFSQRKAECDALVHEGEENERNEKEEVVQRRRTPTSAAAL